MTNKKVSLAIDWKRQLRLYKDGVYVGEAFFVKKIENHSLKRYYVKLYDNGVNSVVHIYDKYGVPVNKALPRITNPYQPPPLSGRIITNLGIF